MICKIFSIYNTFYSLNLQKTTKSQNQTTKFIIMSSNNANPVTFHVQHLGKICTNDENHEEKKKMIQEMFQKHFLPTELPHTAGITVDIKKHGIKESYNGCWYSADIKFDHLYSSNSALIKAYNLKIIGKTLEMAIAPKNYPIRECIQADLISWNDIILA